MAATPNEMLFFYQSGANAALEGLSNAKAKVKIYSDLFGLAQHLNGCFEDLLAAGKIEWRHRLGDPHPTLAEALRIAKTAASELGKVRETDLGKQHFKFGSAAILSYLLENSFDRSVLGRLPKYQSWKKNKMFIVYTFADVGLVQTLLTGKSPGDWTKMLEESFPEKKRRNLFAETYLSYTKIIQAAQDGDSDAVVNGIEHCAANYELRKKDTGGTYFSSSEGGGLLADDMVDHRLAAIIKYCGSMGIDVRNQIDCIHIWPEHTS